MVKLGTKQFSYHSKQSWYSLDARWNIDLHQFNQDDLIEIIQKTREIAINTKLDSKGERIFNQQNVNVTTPNLNPNPIPTTLSTDSIKAL